MATISSHVLDSIVGTHASGIRIACFRLTETGGSEKIFDMCANEEGRIVEQIDIDASDSSQYELVFHNAAYFDAQPGTPEARQIMETIVVRFAILEPGERIHIPVVLSPHAYTIWWSG